MSNQQRNEESLSERIRALLDDPTLSTKERHTVLRELRDGNDPGLASIDIVIRLIERVQAL